MEDNFCTLTDDERRAREWDGKEDDLLALVRTFAPRAYPHAEYTGWYWVGDNEKFPLGKMTKRLDGLGLVCVRAKNNAAYVVLTNPPPPPPKPEDLPPSKHELAARRFDLMVRKDCPLLWDMRQKFPRAYMGESSLVNGGIIKVRQFFLCERGKLEDVRKLVDSAMMDYCKAEIADGKIPHVPARYSVENNSDGFRLVMWYMN